MKAQRCFFCALVLVCIIAINSEVISHSAELAYFKYRVNALIQVLQDTCPEKLSEELGKLHIREKRSTLPPSVQLALEKAHVNQLSDLLLQCANDPLKITAEKPTTSTTTTTTTETPTQCAVKDGYTVLAIDFVQYSNPSNLLMSGKQCDSDGSPCDVTLNICVSSIGRQDCVLFDKTTDIIDEAMSIRFSHVLGGLQNPLSINIGQSSTWKGGRIFISVWDRDTHSSLEAIDRFVFDFNGKPGDAPLYSNLQGTRDGLKSRLAIGVRLFCPEKTTTDSTTSTATPAVTTTPTPITTPPRPTTTSAWTATSTPTPTTTSSWITTTIQTPSTIATNTTPTFFPPTVADPAIVKACAEAVVLSDAMRSQINTVPDIRLCDTRTFEKDHPWFRFSGAAGNRLRNSCPPSNSCGSSVAMWSDTVAEYKQIGVAYDFVAYGSYTNGCRQETYRMQTMRCYNGDIVYRYLLKDLGTYDCDQAFCGMN